MVQVLGERFRIGLPAEHHYPVYEVALERERECRPTTTDTDEFSGDSDSMISHYDGKDICLAVCDG